MKLVKYILFKNIKVFNLLTYIAATGVAALTYSAIYKSWISFLVLSVGVSISFYSIKKDKLFFRSWRLPLTIPIYTALIYLFFFYDYESNDRLKKISLSRVCRDEKREFCDKLPDNTSIYEEKNKRKYKILVLKSELSDGSVTYPIGTTFVYDDNWIFLKVYRPSENADR